MKSEENGNYTLGKWAVESDGGEVVVIGVRRGRACIIAAELYDEENEPSLGEIEANARLIAACPSLFDFVESKAKEGDEDAKKIVNQIYDGRIA